MFASHSKQHDEVIDLVCVIFSEAITYLITDVFTASVANTPFSDCHQHSSSVVLTQASTNRPRNDMYVAARKQQQNNVKQQTTDDGNRQVCSPLIS